MNMETRSVIELDTKTSPFRLESRTKPIDCDETEKKQPFISFLNVKWVFETTPKVESKCSHAKL